MPEQTCTRMLQFSAGHRVYGHESKCASLHGHNYEIEVTAQGKLDDIGRVIDFAVLKERIGAWIDEHWDHGMLLWEQDHDAVVVCRALDHSKVFEMPVNPTAENIATFLLHQSEILLDDTNVRINRVIVRETPNCYAASVLLD